MDQQQGRVAPVLLGPSTCLRAAVERELVYAAPRLDAAMTIRRAEAGESATLLALWQAADATPSPTDTLEDIERALGSDRIACFVAEAGGQLVGSIIAAFDGWRGYIYRIIRGRSLSGAPSDTCTTRGWRGSGPPR